MISMALLALTAPLSLTSAAVPPMPPVIQTRADRTILTWAPGEVRCDGLVMTAERFERPLPNLSWAGAGAEAPVTYAFAIDGTGRAIDIRQVGRDNRTGDIADIAPSLAASRFASESAKAGCMITYHPVRHSISIAPVADLMAYSVFPTSGPLPKEGWERMHSGGNCQRENGPRLRSRAYPDFRSLPATPGVRDWSMVGFDVDADGVPSGVRIIAGTGNAALDEESRNAVQASRFYGGGATGCFYPYWRSPANLAAPSAPEEESFRPEGASCSDQREWTVKPNLQFPEPYRRRAIEGWAAITFDVAPWGEIANIKVVASQPTEDFGTQAVNVVRGAKVATTQGYVGCVEMVKFNMLPENDQPA